MKRNIHLVILFCVLLIQIITAKAQKITAYEIAPNLIVNIEGSYPDGYGPSWRCVDKRDQISYDIWNFNITYGQQTKESIETQLSKYKDKAVFEFPLGYGKSCIADLELPSQKFILTALPTTFQLVNWRLKLDGKVRDDLPCKSTSNTHFNEFKGNITLSANANGDLNLSVLIDCFGVPWRNGLTPPNTFRWKADNVQLTNDISPAKAEAMLVSARKEAANQIEAKRKAEIKQRQRVVFDSLYNVVLPKVKAKAMLMSKTVQTYKGYGLKEVLKLDKMIVARSCPFPRNSTEASFANEDKNLLMIDVDRMVLQYSLFGVNVERTEPHKRDEMFATAYLAVKGINEMLIEAAAYYSICDIDSFKDILATFSLQDPLRFVDNAEFRDIVEYMQRKK